MTIKDLIVATDSGEPSNSTITVERKKVAIVRVANNPATK